VRWLVRAAIGKHAVHHALESLALGGGLRAQACGARSWRRYHMRRGYERDERRDKQRTSPGGRSQCG
jgi:hypothetical protein